jgi:hypothetical protein
LPDCAPEDYHEHELQAPPTQEGVVKRLLVFSTLKAILSNLRPQPKESDSIASEGHREFVGGLWAEMGRLQFDFLLAQGLRPQHVLIDVASGSLRAGRLLIPYLEPGNYLGIDKHQDLVEAGKREELRPSVLLAKRPEFVISDRFEFAEFSRQPDFAIAQSLITHLDKLDIELCFHNLYAFAKPGCRFFATFGEIAFPVPQWAASHSVRQFFYTRLQMERFGREAGWAPRYIGEWGHARGQRLMEYAKP